MYISKILIFFFMMGNLSVFSQEKTVKDFNNDSYNDTLIFKVIRLPKNIPTYIELIDGKTSAILRIELNDGFNPYSLSESYIFDYENFVPDENLIKKIFSEIYNDKIEKLDTNFKNCDYPQQGFKLIDISNENKYFDSYTKDICFRYDSVLPELQDQYILVDSLQTLWENHLCCDFSGEFDSNYKKTGKVLWHFWGNEIKINEFTHFKLNDTISYYENFGCSYLKNGDLYTWINLTPQRNFWSKNMNDTYEPKAILVHNYLFIKKRYLNVENIEIINIKNGNRAVLTIKDLKDFHLKNNDFLEVTKHHGSSETFRISSLLKGW